MKDISKRDEQILARFPSAHHPTHLQKPMLNSFVLDNNQYQSARTDIDTLLVVTDSPTQAISHAHLSKSDPSTTRYLILSAEQLTTKAGQKRVMDELKSMPKKARALNAVADKEAQDSLQDRFRAEGVLAQRQRFSPGKDFESQMLKEHGHVEIARVAESKRFAGMVQTLSEAYAKDINSTANKEDIGSNKRYNQYTPLKDIPPWESERTTAYRSNHGPDDEQIVITNNIQNALAHAARTKGDKTQYLVMDKAEQGLDVVSILKDKENQGKEIIDATDKTKKGLMIHQELHKIAKASATSIDYQPPAEQTWVRQLRAERTGQSKDLVLSH